MKLQVLISTMNQTDYSLLERMNIHTEAVVINQCNNNSVKQFKHNGKNIYWIDSQERGLSKSRNLALSNSSSDICILADDDEVFCDNYENVIISAFKKWNEYDLISFQVQGIEEMFKKYSNIGYDVNYLKSMKIASVEIAFKIESVKKYNILFDELLGAGTKFLMGEENAFLWNCLRSGLKIRYNPEEISYLHIGNSTWNNGRDEKFFIGRGASFTGMSRTASLPLILQFAVRKRKMYSIKMIDAIKYMLAGRSMYINSKNKNIND
ncbi:MAG: glycosyltransferase [Oscillospiraceae bacterium]|nr:glycosyltransferase [Oscillospiraceae bacterium]